ASMPLDAFFPDRYAKWSRLSCLLAALLSVAGVALAAAMIVRQRHGEGRGTALILAASAAFCSPIVYLVSSGRIYHEAILWGLAGSAAALPAIVWLVFYDARSIAALFALSVAAAVTLLARITFALPLYAIFVLSSVRALQLGRNDGRGVWPRVIAAGIPALVGGLFQLWYDYARFGSVFTALDYDFFYVKPAKFGGEFNLARIPDAFAGYFGVRADHFSRYLPYALVAPPNYARPEIFFAWREGTFPLTLSAAPLLLLAAWGMFLLVENRQRPALAVSLVFSGQIVLIL